MAVSGKNVIGIETEPQDTVGCQQRLSRVAADRDKTLGKRQSGKRKEGYNGIRWGVELHSIEQPTLSSDGVFLSALARAHEGLDGAGDVRTAVSWMPLSLLCHIELIECKKLIVTVLYQFYIALQEIERTHGAQFENTECA
ncbi:hypothetical protein Q1695_012162 [Nippostrongylus brasiliensis]|nr:hypothetical protein Q1695_012162 [Nippostrongylus brasiliensis]